MLIHALRTRLAGIPFTRRPDGLEGGPPESAPRLNIGGGVPPIDPSDGPTDPNRAPPAAGAPKPRPPLEPFTAADEPLLEAENAKGAAPGGIAANGFDVGCAEKPGLELAGANAAANGDAVEGPLPKENEGAAAVAEAAGMLELPNENEGAATAA